MKNHHYVYCDIDTKKEKSQGQWLNSRRSAERQQMIRRAAKALKEAPQKFTARDKRRHKQYDQDFEPVVVEVNAITYEEG